jgi:hypothetical protein
VKGEGAANKEELKDTVAHVVEDIKASDQPGEAGNPVPIGPILAIVGSLAVGAAGYMLTRKKKKTDGGDTSKVPDHAELRVFKGFGDTLTPGEERQQLFARIVRVRKDGTEYTDLTLTQMIVIIVTATLASIGTAGTSGAGMIMLAMVLDAVGVPPTYIGIIYGIDRLFDMGRTALNVIGDVSCSVCVHQWEAGDLKPVNK